MNNLTEMLASIKQEEVIKLAEELIKENKSFEELVEMIKPLRKRIESDDIEDGKEAMKENMVIMHTMHTVYKEEMDDFMQKAMQEIHKSGVGQNG